MTNTNAFQGKTAIVTGAAVGIGYEIARQLTEQGVSVVLNDIDEDAAQTAVQKLRDNGGQAVAVAGDSSDLDVIDSMVKQAIDGFGSLDFVVANAGITVMGEFLDYPVEDFERVTTVNLRGTFFLAQRAAQHMVENGGGRMVFTSSTTGHQAHPQAAAYGMTKAAVRMLAKILGVELASHGITVNAVSPGATLTERTMEDGDYEEMWSNLIPLGHPATPADIAPAVLFLLSPGASQITGQTLVIDGGWTSVSPKPDV